MTDIERCNRSTYHDKHRHTSAGQEVKCPGIARPAPTRRENYSDSVEGRNGSFTAGSGGLPPRGRIITDPAALRELRNEKLRYDHREE